MASTCPAWPCGETATVFSTTDGGNGWWSIRNVWGNRDLVFIKTRNTGSGKIELFGASAAALPADELATPTAIGGSETSNRFFNLKHGLARFVKFLALAAWPVNASSG